MVTETLFLDYVTNNRSCKPDIFFNSPHIEAKRILKDIRLLNDYEVNAGKYLDRSLTHGPNAIRSVQGTKAHGLIKALLYGRNFSGALFALL